VSVADPVPVRLTVFGMTRTPLPTDGGLTFDLRGLVWGIECEVAVITSLCGRIDEHVRALNVARADAARRISQLDELLAGADDERLRAWLAPLMQVAYPQVAEEFPDRLYVD